MQYVEDHLRTWFSSLDHQNLILRGLINYGYCNWDDPPSTGHPNCCIGGFPAQKKTGGGNPTLCGLVF